MSSFFFLSLSSLSCGEGEAGKGGGWPFGTVWIWTPKRCERMEANSYANRPRMTLKLRRIDRGIQYKSGQEWQWKGRMEKQRTRFNM